MIKSIESDQLRIEYLTHAGPRITGLFLPGSDLNLFADLPGAGWDTPYGKYLVLGGHRLWHAPEVTRRTYVPDNNPVEVEDIPGGVRLVQPAEPPTGIAKTIEIRVEPGRAGARIIHTLRNDNLWEVELAPWAITQMRLGGAAILPQRTHPIDPDRLLPNRNIVLWSYAIWNDERLALGDELILLEGRPQVPPFKLGYANFDGWAAYLFQDLLFIKSFPPYDLACRYVDMGCNTESYVNDQFLEVESLGPLARLAPSQSVDYVETWHLVRLPTSTRSITSVRQVILETLSAA